MIFRSVRISFAIILALFVIGSPFFLVNPHIAYSGPVGGGGEFEDDPNPGSGEFEDDPSTGGGGGLEINIENPIRGSGNLYDFLFDLIHNIVLPIGGILAVLYIMYAGFLLVTAAGDEKQISAGRTAFLHAAIGTAILIGAEVIAQIIKATMDQLR